APATERAGTGYAGPKLPRLTSTLSPAPIQGLGSFGAAAGSGSFGAAACPGVLCRSEWFARFVLSRCQRARRRVAPPFIIGRGRVPQIVGKCRFLGREDGRVSRAT